MKDYSELKKFAENAKNNWQDSILNKYGEVELFIEHANPMAVLELITEVELLKSNNADMILRNKILRERPDLKPDRIACHSSVVSIQNDLLKLKQENESLKKDAARYRWLRKRAVMFNVSCEGSNNKDAYLSVTGWGDDDSSEIIDRAVDFEMEKQ